MNANTTKHLIVSLHDLHPGSLFRIQEQVYFLKNLGVNTCSILCIPHYHHHLKLEEDSPTMKWLGKQASLGNDLVLHGYYHDRADHTSGSFFYTRLYTANEAEFLDLSDTQVRERLETGSALWKKESWPLHGFIAPAWLMPAAQNNLLQQMGFLYTTRLKGIDLLTRKTYIPSQSLCYSTRARWRKVTSLGWNRYLSRRLLSQNIIRLSLHPNDLTFPAIRKQITSIIQMTLASGYEPVSYSQYAQM